MTQPDAHDFDVAVIGAGAAGMMCAIEAGKRGRRVLLLEKARKCGQKILISGGGRCNFTNLFAGPEKFISENPHFCKSALRQYTQTDFITFVEKHGIAYHEKKLGQLFCDDNSARIVDMLELRFGGNVAQKLRRSKRMDFLSSLAVKQFSCKALLLQQEGSLFRSWGQMTLPIASPRALACRSRTDGRD